MDSSHSPPPPPTPPELKSGPGASQAGGRANPAPQLGEPAAPARLYPRPPRLFPRLLLLCLRPETWAEVARYPSRFTFIPLLVAIVIAGLAVGIAESTRTILNMTAFAGTYDAKGNPPLELNSDGVLSTKGALAAPIRYDNGPNSFTILIDPTGATIPESIKSGQTILFTDKEVWVFAQPDSALYHSSLSDINSFLPAKGEKVVINGTTMQQYFQEHGTGMGAMMSCFIAAALFIGNTLWSALMMFLVSPLVMIAAATQRMKKGTDARSAMGGGGVGMGRLILPRRASYRIAAAVLVPLVMFDGLLRAAGHPVHSLLGAEGSSLFWFLAAAGMALWAGIMARGMYAPKVVRVGK